MGLMYAWATPERLLWKMAYSQIAMYVRYGYEIKYPDTVKAPRGKSIVEMSKAQQSAKIRDIDKFRKQFGIKNG